MTALATCVLAALAVVRMFASPAAAPSAVVVVQPAPAPPAVIHVPSEPVGVHFAPPPP